MKKLLTLFVLLTAIGCKNKDGNGKNDGQQPANEPKIITYSILTSYPHDTSSFTQGLIIYKGEMYENTGRENKNANMLMKVDMKTGKIDKSVSLDKKYF
ncbi:MAG TPA: glutaminyl-peptide cyclotransferase, partial [Chitinophagaceae bacterium]|nr:glutaminyl-peptide cyclotransferase [Chitinophagaceae bacterium]